MKTSSLCFLSGCLFCVLSWTASASGEAEQTQFLGFVQQQVLLKDSQHALASLRRLKTMLQEVQTGNPAISLAAVQQQFRILLLAWKRVETVYLAGGLDSDLIDHPRFIDFYHQANESIATQVRIALQSEEALPAAFYKNSSKSLNALEFLLFSGPDKTNPPTGKTLQAALLCIDHIDPWLAEITGVYQNSGDFAGQQRKVLTLLVNRLIDSSYKLKNWRVGEAGGLVDKYRGKPSSARLEYVLSHTSLAAIIAILETHRKIVKNDKNLDLMSIARQSNVTSELRLLIDKIDQALLAARELATPLEDQLESPAYRKLFKALDELYNAYYFLLIEALNLNAQIIDADGD